MYNSPYSSTFHCANQLYRNEGFRAFYRSYTTQCAMNVPNHGLLILVYGNMQKYFNAKGENRPEVHCAAGAVAGGVSAAITTPLDVCKTLLNTQESSALNKLNESRITGIRNAIQTVYAMQGIRGFFKGLCARIVYQMPSTALSFSVYEMFKHYLKSNDSDCSPDQGNELLKDGVIGEKLPPSGEDSLSGWGGGGKTGLVVQEKKYGGLGAAGTVERLRTLHVSSSLTASCSAAAPSDDKLLVK